MANQYIVDVSSYNGAVDWEALKAKGITGAIIKIIRKDLGKDKRFDENYNAVRKLGLPWGVYHYTYATTPAKAKSDLKIVCDILDKIDRTQFKYGVWFDIENDLQKKLSKPQITEILNAARDYVESRGYTFGIYTGMSFYAEHIDGRQIKCSNWWIARYYADQTPFKYCQAPNEKYKPTMPQNIVAWQYTSHCKTDGLMTGSSGNCDQSLLYRLPTAPAKKQAAKTVRIGSARIDERGKISGGAAGDQTGGEVSVQDWYLHKKGWVVLRPMDPAVAERIASAMEKARANAKIGYDQAQRNTLYKAAAAVGFDPSKVTKNVETDCSALVRVCCAYAGIGLKDFNTASEKTVLLGSGAFRQLADVYSTRPDYLRRGDVLVTKGHTVVVLSDGAQAKQVTVTKAGYSGAFPTLPARGFYQYGDGTKNLNTSAHHTQIKRVQALVNWITGGKIAVDGHYGVQTELAVRAAQKLLGEKADGKFGAKTLAAAKKYKK